MMTCKQVSKALAEGDYKELPWARRFLLHLHIALCFICRQSNRQVMLFYDIVRAYKRHEDSHPSTVSLPDDAKQRIRAALKK